MLKQRTILLTSGPTSAPLDAVRYITNRSSGRLGSVIARELSRAGANVIQLAGENSLTAHDVAAGEDLQVEVERFHTVKQLKNQLQDHLQHNRVDAVLMAAAVLDYIPAEPVRGKHSSQEEEWIIRLKRGEKLIEQLRTWSPHPVIVGFKLESGISLDQLVQRSKNLMDRSDAAMVLANLAEEVSEDKHTGYLIQREEDNRLRVSEPLTNRQAIAHALIEQLHKILPPK